MQKYLSPIKRLGGFALLFLIIGFVRFHRSRRALAMSVCAMAC